ncbi:MAG: hypothetical protein AMJ92_12380 [candidate division Zixibacteria bacterium SM23_81]|nr:MAG: hypothetical protein AMJ92_12380 [candidate division Zixibacteria bacterium SM23_81]
MREFIKIGMSVCLAALLAKVAFAYEDGDWQFWSSASIQVNLSESWRAGLEQQFRLGESMSELYYRYTDFGVTWKARPWFYLGCDIAQIYEKREGDWKEENRPHLNGTFKWSWREFGFENRHRIERRIREERENIWMYRNNLSSLMPLKWTRWEIRPYLADEIFFILDESGLYRHRFTGGFKGQIVHYLGVDIYYLWQSSKKGEDWIDYHVVGAKLKTTF